MRKRDGDTYHRSMWKCKRSSFNAHLVTLILLGIYEILMSWDIRKILLLPTTSQTSNVLLLSKHIHSYCHRPSESPAEGARERGCKKKTSKHLSQQLSQSSWHNFHTLPNSQVLQCLSHLFATLPLYPPFTIPHTHCPHPLPPTHTYTHTPC